MTDPRMKALFGLTWNPFSQDVPIAGLMTSPKVESFCQRIETLVLDGGFAMITGEPGTGKSVLLRLLAERLQKMRELTVVELSRPQSGMTDFYREISARFGLSTGTANRWGGFKALRDRWLAHIETTLLRPVLLIDESQEMPSAVLSEIRLLSSIAFDSRAILTVVLAGDNRLPDRFRTAELLPLDSRIKTRFRVEPASREELAALVQARMTAAGNPGLMTPELVETLAERSLGNARALLNVAGELLAQAMERDLHVLDEKLLFDLYPTHDPRPQRKTALRRA